MPEPLQPAPPWQIIRNAACRQVVRDAKALAFDYADASARLEMVPRFDWAGRRRG